MLFLTATTPKGRRCTVLTEDYDDENTFALIAEPSEQYGLDPLRSTCTLLTEDERYDPRFMDGAINQLLVALDHELDDERDDPDT